ncbi:DUF362 domain-containing protein [Candidatus Poribacteria bacterium]|nr:DUF362 domain-containing protein [Candidatus Poribacteria bacterium]
MTKTTFPTSDSVVEQIMADCEQISQELPAISRRHFLKGAIGAGIALGAISPAIAQVRQPPFLAEEFQKPLVPVVEAMSEKVWDGDVLNEDVVSEMIDQAMMKLTGLDSAKEAWKDFVLPNDIVGIKINPLAGKRLSTHRIIVDKIIDGLYGAGVLKNQIIVWDRFEKHLIDAGYEINQSDKDVRVFASDSPNVGYDDEVYYETEKDVEVRRESGNTRSRYTKIVSQEVTVIINVPVMKHHGITGVSACLKNLAFGSVDNTLRFHSNPLNCDPAISDIFAHAVIKDKLVLNIVDGLLAAFDGGPTYDPDGTWKYGGIFVSSDPVALDQFVLDTINEKRQEVNLDKITRLAKYISSSWRAGLGTNDSDEMDYQEVKV